MKRTLTPKLEKFYAWQKNKIEFGDSPTYMIPTVRLFEQYQMEAEEDIEDLTDEEIAHIKVKQENLTFALAVKGIIKTDMARLMLANDFGWSERAKQKEEAPIDYVVFDSEGMLSEPTVNHEGESFENDAVKAIGK